jgi:phage-related protein
MTGAKPKELVWLASSLKDLRDFPEDVRQVMGFALFMAQAGGKHPAAKPLRGFHGAGVLEVVDDLVRPGHMGNRSARAHG